MEHQSSKYSHSSIHSRLRSGSNKENQAPTGGGHMGAFRNHHAVGPIGIPFKAKNSNSLHFHNNGTNLLRNQKNAHQYDKLNLHQNRTIQQNNSRNNNNLNINLNNANSGFIRKANASYSSDEGMGSLQSSMNGLSRNMSKSSVNQLSASINSNLSTKSNNHKLSDLYRPHLSGSSSSLQSYSSNDNSSKEDKRFLPPPPPKQNIMYHEQRYKTELCRAYEEQNNCVYGDRCMFAHGISELKRPMNRHPKYKTQKCVAFEEQGLCMFGTRCSFLHEKIGTAEEIVDSMLKLNKQTFPMPENPNKQPDAEQLSRLNAIDEQEFIAKSIDGMEQRAQFLSTLKSENLFNWTTSKPVFNLHPKSSHGAFENIVRLESFSEHMDKEKDKLLPDLTSLLVDEHADTNSLLFSDEMNTSSSRLPIFKKISLTSDPQITVDESSSVNVLDCSNNSSKSTISNHSNASSLDSQLTLTASTMSISSRSSSQDLKSMDFEIDNFLI